MLGQATTHYKNGSYQLAQGQHVGPKGPYRSRASSFGILQRRLGQVELLLSRLDDTHNAIDLLRHTCISADF